MKCSACEAQKCGRQYDDRLFCVGKKEKIECTCTCQVSATETAVTGLISAGLGIGLVAGGIALTLMSGGLFAIVAGSAAIGAGSSLVTNPIQKAFAGEHMTLKDTIVDTATGTVIGSTHQTELFSTQISTKCTDTFRSCFWWDWSVRIYSCKGQ